MRITFVIPAYLPALAYGGPVTHISQLAVSLASRGHEVQVLTSNLGPLPHQRLPVGEEFLNGVRVLRYATPFRYRWAGFSPAFRREAATALEGSDLLHVVCYRDGFGATAARHASRLGLPWLLEPMGMLRVAGRSQLKKRLFDTLLGNRLVDGATFLIHSSEIEAREFRAAGIPKDRLRCVRMGMRLPEPPSREDCLALRKKLGIHPTVPVVVYLGRINYRKGLAYVAARLRHIATSGLGNFRYLLAGPDEGDGTREAVLEALGPFAERAIFTGGVYDQDKWTLLATSDVFALASPFAENFGIAGAEALAMGTPIVVSNICGVGDLVDEESGAVLSLHDPEWESTLLEILDGSRVFDREKVRAAVAPLEIERVTDVQLQVYDEILSG